MSRVLLPNVTLVCVEDGGENKVRIASEIIKRLEELFRFHDTKLLSSCDLSGVTNKIFPINTLEEYSVFILNDLINYIDSEFVMIIQTDGYPLNPSAWSDIFLEYDYIGAPWNRVISNNGTHSVIPSAPEGQLHASVGMTVGNGGFSIRSRKLLEEVASTNYRCTPLDWPEGEVQGWKFAEDEYICKYMSADLKSKGYTFAPVELAQFFSAENDILVGQFGFHGRDTIELNKKLGFFKFSEHAYENRDVVMSPSDIQ